MENPQCVDHCPSRKPLIFYIYVTDVTANPRILTYVHPNFASNGMTPYKNIQLELGLFDLLHHISHHKFFKTHPGNSPPLPAAAVSFRFRSDPKMAAPCSSETDETPKNWEFTAKPARVSSAPWLVAGKSPSEMEVYNSPGKMFILWI